MDAPRTIRHLETADRSEVVAYQLAKLQSLVESTWKRNRFYRDFWAGHGAARKPITSFEQFRDEIPLIRKADLIADQAQEPPYGKRLAPLAAGKQPFLLFNTSGTTGQGVELHAISMRERTRAYAVSNYLYRWSGLTRGHRLFLCYPVSMLGGGRIELYGLEHYGLSVYPVGSYDVQRKLELIRRFKPHAIMATTSYLGHLAAVGHATGELPRPKVLFGGGEGASYSWFEQQQEIWGAPIFNHYGSTQTRVDHMYPCERGIGTRERPGLLHNIESGFHFDVVDPATGAPVRDGELGEIVVTSLIHTDFPLIRYAMGDVAVYREWRYCPCGRSFSGIEIGTIGRKDDMKKIKGINVWPQAVDEAIFVHEGVDEYQVVLARDERQADVARVRVMPKPELAPDAIGGLCERIGHSLRERIGIRFEVEGVALGQLSRSEYKARRWIDERQQSATARTGAGQRA